MSESPESDPGPPDRPRRFPDLERSAAALDALDLEPLTTVCPTCTTRFRVTEAQLQAARGRVRCGACGSVFDGVDQLVLDMPREFSSSHDAERALDELMAELMADSRVMPPPQAAEPAPDAAALPVSAAAAAPAGTGVLQPGAGTILELPAATEPVPLPDSTGAVASAGSPAAESGVAAASLAPAGEAIAEHGAVVAPPVAQPVAFGRPRGRSRPWIWLLALAAALALAAQILWFRFDDLARDPAWRPVYAGICGWAGCELPVLRARELIRTRNLTVQSAGEGALLVRVLIVNEADFAQPFPALELRFSELRGAVVAGHRFQPRDYLAGDARDLELMPVRIPVQLELRIPDPGPHAVNYELNLR